MDGKIRDHRCKTKSQAGRSKCAASQPYGRDVTPYTMCTSLPLVGGLGMTEMIYQTQCAQSVLNYNTMEATPWNLWRVSQNQAKSVMGIHCVSQI